MTTMSSTTVDQNLKRLNYTEKDLLGQDCNFVAYVQCPFYDDEKCLITLSVFREGSKADDLPLIGEGFYVMRRGEGGISWQGDVVPYVRRAIQTWLHGSYVGAPGVVHED